MTTCPTCLTTMETAGRPCATCQRHPTDVARRRAAHFGSRAVAALRAGQLALAADLAEVAGRYGRLAETGR